MIFFFYLCLTMVPFLSGIGATVLMQVNGQKKNKCKHYFAIECVKNHIEML